MNSSDTQIWRIVAGAIEVAAPQHLKDLPMREERQREDRIRDRFEKFTASAAWRELPLKIKLIVLHLWRAERDGPSDKQ